MSEHEALVEFRKIIKHGKLLLQITHDKTYWITASKIKKQLQI